MQVGQQRPQGKTWRLKKHIPAGSDGPEVENKLGLLIASFDNLLGA